MTATRAPERVRWALHVLDLAGSDRVLEIGCGSGVAVSLVCDRLTGGRIAAIDRSATAIRKAATRNAAHVVSGQAVLIHTDLRSFPIGEERFDKIFAINVNLFWVDTAAAELMVIKEVLSRAGSLHLFYERPAGTKVVQTATAIASNLSRHGFSTVVRQGPSPTLFCLSARPPPHTLLPAIKEKWP